MRCHRERLAALAAARIPVRLCPATGTEDGTTPCWKVVPGRCEKPFTSVDPRLPPSTSINTMTSSPRRPSDGATSEIVSCTTPPFRPWPIPEDDYVPAVLLTTYHDGAGNGGAVSR